MKNKLYLFIVILGLTFLFLSINLNIKIVNQLYNNFPSGVNENNFVSFFQKEQGNAEYSKLSEKISEGIGNLPFVESLAIYNYVELDVGLTEKSLSQETVALVNDDFFDTLELTPVYGTYSKKSTNITLTYSYALEISRHPSELIGKSIFIKGYPYVIGGIWPKNFFGVGNSDSIYVSAEIYQKTLNNRFIDQPDEWQKELLSSNTDKFVFAKIEDLSQLDDLNENYIKELPITENELTFVRKNGEEVYFNFTNQNNIKAIEGIILKPNEKEKLLKIIEPVQWIISLLLLSTIFSYIYYQMSQLPVMHNKLNIKVLCGAPASSIFFEFFIKSIFPLLIGFILSLPLVDIAFNEITKIDLFKSYFSYSVENEYLTIYLGIILALLISIVSSIVNTYFTFEKITLNTGTKITKSKIETIFEKVALLILIIFGICATFITSILVADEYVFSKTNRGYDTQNMYNMIINKRENASSYADLLELFDSKSEIVISPYNTLMPIDELESTVLHLDDSSVESKIYFVGNNFFDVTKIKILLGNCFDVSSPSGVVVSESLLSKLNLNAYNAIGKQVFVEVFGGARMPQIIIAISQTLPESGGEVYLNSFNPNSFTLELDKFLVRSNESMNSLPNTVTTLLDSIGWDLTHFSSIQQQIDKVNESKNSLILLSKFLTFGLMILVITTIIIYIRHDLISNLNVRKIKTILGANFSTLIGELLNKYLYLLGFSALIGFVLIVFTKSYLFSFLSLEHLSQIQFISIYLVSALVISALTFVLVVLLSLNERKRL